MRCVAALAAFGGGVLLATSASATEPEHPMAPAARVEPSPSGPRVGLRSGLALPVGTMFTSSGAMNETIAGYVPLRLDIGYRLASHFYVGANAQFATVLPKACPSGASCTGTDMRVGLTAAFHLLPRRLVDPWIGVGMGIEWLNVSRTVDGTTVDVNARGLELIDVELGADVRPAAVLRIGPVLSGSVGRYTRIAVNGVETTDFTPSLHSWVMLGVRGAFDM
jgi:hypothetical protein